MALHTGLVSISFRKLKPEAIAELVSEAGLEGIEWGDVHVPHGNLVQAKRVAALTKDHGLQVAAYGSYYRLGDENDVTFEEVLDTAVALAAPVIRVWAGRKGSEQVTRAYRNQVTDDALRCAEIAEEAGLSVACEFHVNTLTDTTESALTLLDEALHPAFFTYWQPPVGWSDSLCDESLRTVLNRLRHLHVYQWDGKGVRLPLAVGRERWQGFLATADREPVPYERFALLEFVRDDSPDAFREDAAVLRELVAG